MASLYERISKGTMSVDEITESMRYATSEGGKFFQSMEKQSQTLNGQLSTLRDNANQLLGSLTEDLSEELRTSVLPLANNMIGELQSAFAKGGAQGLVDSATAMIPDLLNMMSGEVEKAISGLSKWLPKGATALMKALPSALRGASSVFPQITTALFEVASVIVADLVSMLPELAPVVLGGFVDMVGSILSGAETLIDGLFSGVEQMFHQGQKKIAGVWVDESNLAKYTFDIETDVEPATSAINQAYNDIRAALQTDILTDTQREEILGMIGSDYDTIKAKLLSFGLGEGDASALAEKVTSAGEAIKTEIDKLDIGYDSATVLKWINQANASRLMLKNILASQGLTDAQISEVVGVFDEMAGAVTAGTPSIVEEIYNKLTDGQPDDDQTVTAIRSDISSYIADLNAAVEEEYAKRNAALDTAAADYDAKKAELDAWYNTTKTEITTINTGMVTLVDELAGAPTAVVQARLAEFAEIERQLLGVETKIDELTSKAQSAGANAFSVVRSGANADEATISQAISFKVTEFKLNEQSAEDAYAAAIEDLNAKLASGDITQAEYDAAAGAAAADLESAKTAAKESFNTAFREIIAGIAESEGTSEALKQAMEAIGARLSIEDFVHNMFTDTGEIDTDKLASLNEQLASVLGEAFSPEALQSYLDSDTLGAIDYLETMAGVIEATSSESLETALGGKVGEAWQAALDKDMLTGTDFDVTGTEEQLKALFGEMDLTSVGDDVMAGVGEGVAKHDFSTDTARAEQNLERSMRASLQSHSPAQKMVPIGSDVAAGVGQGMAEYDFSTDAASMADSAEAAANSEMSSGGKTAGKNFAAGVASGIRSGRGNVRKAAQDLAKSAVAAINAELDINSPSRVAYEQGSYFGQGFTKGLQQSMANAVTVAKQMTGQLVTAASIPGTFKINMPNISQEIALANEKTPTVVNIDGHQVAEIQGPNNSAQLALDNIAIAKGVGSR